MATSRVNLIFGRFNPPTIGHERLLKTAVQNARTNQADTVVFVSHTEDRKNPLTYDEKVEIIETNVRGIRVGPDAIRTPLEALTWAFEYGYTDISLFAGEDRLEAFTQLIGKWQDRTDPERTARVQISSQSRQGVMSAAEISGTTARKLARQGKLSEFQRILMGGHDTAFAEEIMNKIQERLGSIREDDNEDADIDIDRLVEMLLTNDNSGGHDSITTFDNPGARPADDKDERVPEDTPDNKSVLILYPDRKLKHRMLNKLKQKKADFEREQEKKARRNATK